ncbi:hypothetical protein AMATHDRAFT_155621 [Amanita thiersii Skay4041]|uniref:Uncharacterized protein n=1 Tax=Amanita thiersii Skay4041 TaxID=703135 RepID=A0A2A9NAI0_9AGAR|nr:hypothetical protein AMATHDRAFT_155621 [Amanita thiersii Skay4041]
MSTLTSIISRGSCLLLTEQQKASASDFKTILSSRLSRYYELSGLKSPDLQSRSLQELQLFTAKAALTVVSEIQEILVHQLLRNTEQHTDSYIAIGTRDLAQLRTLLSIIFKWGTEPLLFSCLHAWSSKMKTGLTIVEVNTISGQYNELAEFIIKIIGLLFPESLNQAPPDTHITVLLINQHLISLLGPCLALGWLPKSLSSGAMTAIDPLRLKTMRLLILLPPSQTITALGGVLSSLPPPSPHMHRICATLLGKQITRPDGVRGLCAAVFGEEEAGGDEAALEKLQHVSHVLTTVPSGTNTEDYCKSIVPQLLTLLSVNSVSLYKSAAAFTISRMLSADPPAPLDELSASLILTNLHEPFYQAKAEPLNQNIEQKLLPKLSTLTASGALEILITLVANMDPLPSLFSKLLSPIFPILYSLLYFLEKTKTSDPGIKESLRWTLISWGKIVDTTEGVCAFWCIKSESQAFWGIDSENNLQRLKRSDRVSSLSFFTPESLQKAQESESLDENANILDLYPDPLHLVHFLKALDRTDITSELFVKFLELYREQRVSNHTPIQTFLTLQIIIQMQKHLSTGPSSSNLLCKPTHILSFIKHVLQSSTVDYGTGRTPDRDTRDPLLIVPEIAEAEEDGDADSDDDMPGSVTVTPDDEMTETAINLLLSTLEANDSLSARTMPVLNDIFSLLESLSHSEHVNIRSIAQEARIVMTARLASTSTPRASSSGGKESSQGVYQKALRLLQDPILPVRAHGLLLLRQLVNQYNSSSDPQEVDAALMPAILSIFLQSVQDDESYLFLNAVQGLAAMVDTHGRDVLKTLVREYSQGLLGISTVKISRHDLDIRTRIGEALGQVIRRCGTALGIYADLLVPPLFDVIRSQDVPTILRTSSLSLLADCVNTYPLATLPYISDLTEAMVDLLRIESVPAKEVKQTSETLTSTEETETRAPSMNSEPTSANSKFPPLRRAALHFLSLLIRSATRELYDTSSTSLLIPIDVINQTKTTLSYITSTDVDSVVRVMARETKEGLEQLQRAMLGI